MSENRTSQANSSDGQPHIVVVGSINMDLVTRVDHLPRPGQTVVGTDLQQIPGGKGANQAVAAARLGARCSMIGRVGRDGFGDELIDSLKTYGVDVACVQVTDDTSSGIASIGVEQSGQNAITVVAGANGRLTPDDVGRHESVLAGADALLLQLEVPYDTIVRAVEVARSHGVLSILDPAPAPSDALPSELGNVGIITPNECETEQLTGIAVTNLDAAGQAARLLRNRGAEQVVLKLGERGALVCDDSDNCVHVPAPDVTPVDTTAAGDAFTAAMAVELSRCGNLVESVRFACAAGSVATTKHGAQPSMPSRDEVALLARPS